MKSIAAAVAVMAAACVQSVAPPEGADAPLDEEHEEAQLAPVTTAFGNRGYEPELVANPSDQKSEHGVTDMWSTQSEPDGEGAR